MAAAGIIKQVNTYFFMVYRKIVPGKFLIFPQHFNEIVAFVRYSLSSFERLVNYTSNAK